MSELTLALRLLRRNPGLSLAAIVSLALGIGANTAIFTVLSGSVLRPLPFADSDRLVMVWETSRDTPTRPVAPANFVDWRRDTRSFTGLAAFDVFSTTLTGRSEPERLRAMSASGNFFELLASRTALGRPFTPADDAPGAPPVAVLTDGLWHRLFAGSPTAIGESLLLNGTQHTIVGVLPPGFSMPIYTGEDLWVSGDRGIPRTFPFTQDPTTVRDSHLLWVVGRLAPGVTPEVAQAELSAVMARLATEHPQSNAGLDVNIVGLHEQVVGEVRPVLTLLQLAVGVLLLIACANVAHLLLGQAAGRQGEMTMRLALGAGRGRLVRQMLAETLAIAVPGGALGLIFATWGLQGLAALAPAELPRMNEVTIDGGVLAFTIATTLATCVVFGLGPALHAARAAAGLMPTSGQRVGGAPGVRRWQRALVVAELALAQALLVGAGLLVASFVATQRVDLGFETEGRIAAEISLAPDRYLRPRDAASRDRAIDPTLKNQFITRILDRVREAPQVSSVAAAFTAPLEGAPNRGFRITGDPEPPPNEQPNADFQVVTSGYFSAVGLRLVQGRLLADTDRADTTPVMVVNQALVNTYFAGRNPIGRVIQFGFDKKHEIVGVVSDARYRYVEQPADPTFYLPLPQNDERWPYLSLTVVLRNPGSHAEAVAIAPLIRAAVHEADAAQPISRIRSYEEIVARSLAARRFNTLLIGLFAATALLLAAIGTYGVMAWAVATRAREIGIRAAVGARPADLIAMVMRQGLTLSAIATAVGLAAASAATGFMSSMLYQVSPRDPMTFGAVAALLTAVSLLATFVPARRAARTDPSATLRA